MVILNGHHEGVAAVVVDKKRIGAKLQKEKGRAQRGVAEKLVVRLSAERGHEGSDAFGAARVEVDGGGDRANKLGLAGEGGDMG